MKPALLPATDRELQALTVRVDRAVADLVTGVIDLDARGRKGHEGRADLTRIVSAVEAEDLPRGIPSAIWCAVRYLHAQDLPINDDTLVAVASQWEREDALTAKLRDYRYYGMGGLSALPAADMLLEMREVLDAYRMHQAEMAGLAERLPRIFESLSVWA